MGTTPQYGIYYDDKEMLALGRTQDVKQAQSIENALKQVVSEASPFKKDKVDGSLNLDTAGSGNYLATNATESTNANLPDAFASSVDLTRVGLQGGIIEIKSLSGRSFIKEQYGGMWSEWVETTQGEAERELSRQRLQARKGGVIGTAGKGVIALRFDGSITDFIAQILPLLKERGIPFSFATTVDNVAASDLSALQDSLLSAGGEIWCKGATGTNATGMGAVYKELISAKSRLKTAVPRVPVDCFVPEYGTNYNGYMLSNDLKRYYRSFAGQQVIRTYGLVGGFDPQAYWYELNGQMVDGFTVYGGDLYTTMDRFQARVELARDNKVGMVISFTTDGVLNKVGLPLFTQYLDYLVTARVTEVLELLTISGMASADKSRDSRHDLIQRHESKVFTQTYSETITDPQYRLGVPGSTRILTALVQGAEGTTVTSKINGAEQTHIIPAGGYLDLRRAVTIPLDIATAFTVEISGGYCKDVHFYAA